MKAFVTLLGGLGGAIAGWVAAAGIGPIGGVIGLIVGLWLALRRYR
jgi:hypothetical protein